MSDLQSLKSRIKNIKNTSKVTKAMKLISANKLKKAVKDLQTFHENKLVIDHLFYKMADNDNIAKLSENYQKLLRPSDKISSLMLIVISSNKGLCGNFNSSLFKTIENEITMLLKEGYDISIMVVGSKANNYFKINNQEFLNEMLSNIQKFEVENTNIAMEIMLKKFFTGEIHECRIYYNEFISSISHPVKCEVLLPIELPKISYDNLKTSEGSNVLEKVTKHYLSNKILKSLLESKAGEESSRMAAMDSATNNAVKIYNRLILQYNRTRQASITNEICEIISGSEAL